MRGPAEELSQLLREWDKGGRRVRKRLLAGFAAAHASSTGVELESRYGHGGSLFLSRLTSWLRLTTSSASSESSSAPVFAVSEQLAALSVFLRAASGTRFMEEFLHNDGLSILLQLLQQGSALSEEERRSVLLLLLAILQGGRLFKQYFCDAGGCAAVVEALLDASGTPLLAAGRRLFLEVWTGNPFHCHVVQAALLALLRRGGDKSRVLAAQFCRMTLEEERKAEEESRKLRRRHRRRQVEGSMRTVSDGAFIEDDDEYAAGAAGAAGDEYEEDEEEEDAFDEDDDDFDIDGDGFEEDSIVRSGMTAEEARARRRLVVRRIRRRRPRRRSSGSSSHSRSRSRSRSRGRHHRGDKRKVAADAHDDDVPDDQLLQQQQYQQRVAAAVADATHGSASHGGGAIRQRRVPLHTFASVAITLLHKSNSPLVHYEAMELLRALMAADTDLESIILMDLVTLLRLPGSGDDAIRLPADELPVQLLVARFLSSLASAPGGTRSAKLIEFDAVPALCGALLLVGFKEVVIAAAGALHAMMRVASGARAAVARLLGEELFQQFAASAAHDFWSPFITAVQPGRAAREQVKAALEEAGWQLLLPADAHERPQTAEERILDSVSRVPGFTAFPSADGARTAAAGSSRRTRRGRRLRRGKRGARAAAHSPIASAAAGEEEAAASLAADTVSTTPAATAAAVTAAAAAAAAAADEEESNYKDKMERLILASVPHMSSLYRPPAPSSRSRRRGPAPGRGRVLREASGRSFASSLSSGTRRAVAAAAPPASASHRRPSARAAPSASSSATISFSKVSVAGLDVSVGSTASRPAAPAAPAEESGTDWLDAADAQSSLSRLGLEGMRKRMTLLRKRRHTLRKSLASFRKLKPAALKLATGADAASDGESASGSPKSAVAHTPSPKTPRGVSVAELSVFGESVRESWRSSESLSIIPPPLGVLPEGAV
eukprot:PLAT3679.12.p1 GENE.PLAT3679.12~~PLAT3679.12.p1  ORF type:complete len:988 (-),score=467.64 PLAT3679.12:89-2938(-)